MKRKLIAVLVLLLFICKGMAQESSQKSNSIRIGFQLNEFQEDFGIGLNIESPAIINEYIAVRMRANLMFNEHLDQSEYTWSPYGNLMLGLGSVNSFIAEKVSLYGEGGVIGIFPSSEFSSESLVVGGYGLFGFNFYFHPSFNYFIELGGIGSGAVKDKLEGKPIYSNGFLISVGWKITL